MRYWLVLPAAGVGRRFGGSRPKQYAPLHGRTVIEWVLAAPAADTLKRERPSGDQPAGGDREVAQTVDRAGLWRALTPQMFRYGRLCEALDRALAAGRWPSDEAQALEWLGECPSLVQG